MVKRRGNNRTPAQRRASQQNIKKAQAASAAKRRGTQQLYHHTRGSNADSIVKTGFKAYSEKDRVFFSTKRHGVAGAYGRAIVGVRVPKSKIKADPRQSIFTGGEKFVSVKLKDLQGVKLSRIRRKRA